MAKKKASAPKDWTKLCGFIPDKERSQKQKMAHDAAMAGMAKWRLSLATEPPKQVLLTDLWKHDDIVAAHGFQYPGQFQYTGSCVGVGGMNAVCSTLFAEIVVGKAAKRFVIPFWPFTYGRSRYRGGMTTPGEGSFGSTYADAARLDGFFSYKLEGLPEPTIKPTGMRYNATIEKKWSDGDSYADKWYGEAKQNLIASTAQMKSHEDVLAALANWYGVSCAVSNFVDPQSASIKDGVSLGEFGPRGGHQTSIQGYTKHDKLGYLFWYENQWDGVYPEDPITKRKQGCWITAKSMDWCCKQEEVFAFSGMSGFNDRMNEYIFGE